MQPNSVVSWGDGVDPRRGPTTAGQHTVSTPKQSPPTVNIDDLKGSHAQAGRLTEWLKLALDQPELLETLGATANLGVLVSGPAGVGKAALVRAVCADRRLVELDGPEVGALRAEDRLKSVASAVATVRDGGGVLLITDIDALLPSTADPVATLILAELRNAVGHPRRRVRRHLGGARRRRPTAAGTRPVRPRARAEPARRRHPQAAAGGAAARRAVRRAQSRRNRRAHTGFRRRRSVRSGAGGRVAGGGAGQRGRQAAGADAGGPDRRDDRHPPAVAFGHRRGFGRRR